MARRSLDPTAFRPDRTARVGFAPSKTQTIAMLGVLVLVGAAIAAAAVLIRPNKARAFDLFYGSLYLNDNRAPVAVDLTNGKPTVRLVDADKQVSATDRARPTLEVFPLAGGTLLLNTATGEFNLVDSSGFVVKPTGGGVPLPKVRGTSTRDGRGVGFERLYRPERDGRYAGVSGRRQHRPIRDRGRRQGQAPCLRDHARRRSMPTIPAR